MTLSKVVVGQTEVTDEGTVRADAGLRAHLATIGRVGLIAGQLLLLLLVIRSFRVAPPAWPVMKLTAVGFVVHALLPLRFRLSVFIGLCAVVVVLVLGLL